jgi:thymidylate synthase ThyX
MSYSVKILADSINSMGCRLTTYQLKYPRFIHAEVMTHRAFSRNASSSRAIPVEKMIQWVEDDPAIPIYWGSKKKGMQAGAEIENKWIAQAIWKMALAGTVGAAKTLNALGLHKQIVNRILEPWAHMNVVLSATEYDNFFTLRAHKDAQPEIQFLAVEMAKARRDSTPVRLNEGEWHLPYITPEERASLDWLTLTKASVARCCRVSYLTVDGKPSTIDKDLELHDMLLIDKHMSPFEHVAHATNDRCWNNGNFCGFQQYRKLIPGECFQAFDYNSLDQFEQGYVVEIAA